MRHEADEEPVLVDTRMRASRIAWNSNGTVLAVSGTLPGTSDGKGGPEAKETPAVQFYSNQGKHAAGNPGHEVVDTIDSEPNRLSKVGRRLHCFLQAKMSNGIWCCPVPALLGRRDAGRGGRVSNIILFCSACIRP